MKKLMLRYLSAVLLLPLPTSSNPANAYTPPTPQASPYSIPYRERQDKTQPQIYAIYMPGAVGEGVTG